MIYLSLLAVTLLIIFSGAALMFLLLSELDFIYLLDFFGCVIAIIVLLVSILILFDNTIETNPLTTTLNSVGVELLVL